MVMMSSF